MAGEAVQSPTQVIDAVGGQPVWERDVETKASRIAGIDVLGQAVDLSLAEPEGLGDVSKHGTRPIRDDIGDHGGALSSIPSVAVLDHLFTSIGFQIEVDIGSPTAFLGEKAFEGKPEPDRIHLGQPDAATHRRIAARSANLTVDVAAPGELDQIPHHQEVARKSELLDHPELMFEARLGGRVDPTVASRVHLSSAFKGEVPEILHLGAEMTGHGKVGQLWSYQLQVERQGLAELRGSFDCSRVAREAPMHLLGGFEIPLIGGRPEPVLEVECAPAGNRCHHF